MTSQKDIQNQLSREFDSFYNSLYEGVLPDDILDQFRKALMVIPMNSHKISVQGLRLILKTPLKEFKKVQVGMVVNILIATPLHILSDNLDDALAYHEKLDLIRLPYNKMVSDFEKKMENKKALLMNLSGVEKKDQKQIIVPAK